MYESASPNPALPPTSPRRKASNALAYILALAMPLLALSYLAGAISYTNQQQRGADVYIYERQVTHGFPFVGLTESSQVAYDVPQQKITSLGSTDYNWNALAFLLDAFLWLAVAIFAYWMISSLFASVRYLGGPSRTRQARIGVADVQVVGGSSKDDSEQVAE